MKKTHLNLHQAVPPMPDSFADRMRSTLLRLEAPKRRISRPKPVLVLAAALLAVLMASVAVAQAVDSGILARLFGNSQPSEEAQILLKTGLDSASSEGVTITVDELLFDGRSLNCDWTLSSEREGMVYLLSGVRLEGASEDLLAVGGSLGMTTSVNVGDNVLAALGEAGEVSAPLSQKGWAQINFVEPLTEEATLVITAHAYTSDLTPVPVDSFYPGVEVDEQTWVATTDDLADAQDVCARLEANRQIGVYGDLGDYTAQIADYPAFEAALADFPDDMDWDQANIDAHEASGLLQPLTVLEIRLPLIPDTGTTTTFGPETFEMDNCRVEVHSLSFSPALTCASISVYPKEAVSMEELFTNYRFFLADDQGNPLLMNVDGNLVDGEAGVACYEMELSGAPLAEIPESIHLIRVSGRKEGEGVVSHYKRLFAEAPEGERAVMQLK